MSLSYTYPVAYPSDALTTEQIHLLLSNPRVIAKRVAILASMGFLADFLLSGRFKAIGGGVFYETGEEIFAEDAPEAVAPNAEYPKTAMTAGELAAAKTVKWGLETTLTDEKISREGMSVVNKALARLANTVIRHVDGVAWGVISAKVTSTAASDSWTSPGAAVKAVTAVQLERANLATGLNLNTIVLPPAQYANVLSMLVDAKVLPVEGPNPVKDGTKPVNALGLTWATSPFVTGTDPWLVDRDQLGGMADEKLTSPGYASASGTNIEGYTSRTQRDSYDVRARRVTVPVVTEPLAGVRLTGTGLA